MEHWANRELWTIGMTVSWPDQRQDVGLSGCKSVEGRSHVVRALHSAGFISLTTTADWQVRSYWLGCLVPSTCSTQHVHTLGTRPLQQWESKCPGPDWAEAAPWSSCRGRAGGLWVLSVSRMDMIHNLMPEGDLSAALDSIILSSLPTLATAPYSPLNTCPLGRPAW